MTLPATPERVAAAKEDALSEQLNKPREIKIRLTTATLDEFCVAYKRGQFLQLRFGQAAYWHFGLRDGAPFTESQPRVDADGLFYEGDDVKAEAQLRDMLRRYQA